MRPADGIESSVGNEHATHRRGIARRSTHPHAGDALPPLHAGLPGTDWRLDDGNETYAGPWEGKDHVDSLFAVAALMIGLHLLNLDNHLARYDPPLATEQLANARLIAAAPDLLAALELWQSTIEMYDVDDGICTIYVPSGTIDAAAAIAKARGE